MIYIQCPRCDKRLAVAESQAGKVGICPGCKSKFRIPAAPAVDEFARPPRKKPEPSHEEDVPSTPLRKRRHVEDYEEQPADVDEVERLPARKRRRKRRRHAPGLLGRLNGLTVAIICLFGLSFGLPLIWPKLAIVPFCLGLLVALGGEIWFVIVAFQDNVLAGLLCLFLPIFSLYYLITHFEEVKDPFFTQLAGSLIITMSVCGGALSRQRENVPPRQRGEHQIQAVAFLPNNPLK